MHTTSILFVLPLPQIVGYVIKDRMKELGKRYLVPIGEGIGVRFPDRIRKLHDFRGKAHMSLFAAAHCLACWPVHY